MNGSEGGLYLWHVVHYFDSLLSQLHFTQNIREKSQHSLKTTFIRWIFYVQFRDLESMWLFFRPWKAASSGWSITVLNRRTAGLPNRLRKEKAMSPHGRTDDPARPPCPLCWLLLPRPLRRHAGQEESWGQFFWKGLREGGGMGQMSIKAGFPPRASMASEVSLSETCQTVDDPVLPLLFGLTWNSHHESLLGLKKGVFSRARLLKCTRKGKALTPAHTNTDSSYQIRCWKAKLRNVEDGVLDGCTLVGEEEEQEASGREPLPPGSTVLWLHRRRAASAARWPVGAAVLRVAGKHWKRLLPFSVRREFPKT